MYTRHSLGDVMGNKPHCRPLGEPAPDKPLLYKPLLLITYIHPIIYLISIYILVYIILSYIISIYCTIYLYIYIQRGMLLAWIKLIDIYII